MTPPFFARQKRPRATVIAGHPISGRDREEPSKNRPQAGEAGETACPISESTGLVVVAQAVSPAHLDFLTAREGAVSGSYLARGV